MYIKTSVTSRFSDLTNLLLIKGMKTRRSKSFRLFCTNREKAHCRYREIFRSNSNTFQNTRNYSDRDGWGTALQQSCHETSGCCCCCCYRWIMESCCDLYASLRSEPMRLERLSAVGIDKRRGRQCDSSWTHPQRWSTLIWLRSTHQRVPVPHVNLPRCLSTAVIYPPRLRYAFCIHCYTEDASDRLQAFINKWLFPKGWL